MGYDGAYKSSAYVSLRDFLTKIRKVRIGVRRESRITSKGQVTVPKDIRRALRAREGDVLVFEAGDDEARVRVVRKPVSFADYAGAWREGSGMSVAEINAEVRELRGHGEG